MAGALEIARRALDELGFFSKALEEAKGAKMKSGTVQQWKNALQKQGVKPAELDATGFSALPADKPLSKDDLVDYLTQNRVQLSEKKLTKGDAEAARVAREEAYLARDRAYDDYVNYVTENRWRMSHPADPPNEFAQEALRLYQLHDAAARRYNDLRQASFRANDTLPKYEQWSLPGGQNYQETLLTLPQPGPSGFEVVLPDGQRTMPFPTRQEAFQWNERNGSAGTIERVRPSSNGGPPTFGPHNNPHWDDPNVAVHYRTKERLGPNGERVLHIDEVQSDWGQQGAREGFFDPNLQKAQREAEAAYKKASDDYMQVVREHQQFVRENYPRDFDMSSLSDAELQPLERARQDRMRADPRFGELLARRDAASNRMSETRAAIGRLPSQDGTVPMAPFVTDEKAWTDLALKRAMIEAERGGYDALAFTRGAEQAERYNLSNRVGRIYYNPETRRLEVSDPDYRLLHEGEYAPEKLAEVIGRENAERLLQAPTTGGSYHRLDPEDMVWGSKGMTRYYDQALPSRIDKLARSLDPEARLETMPAGRGLGIAGEYDAYGNPVGSYRVYDTSRPYDDPGNTLAEFATREEAQPFVDAGHWPRSGAAPQLNMLRLTPRMKEQIRQGLPLFVGAPAVVGGALSQAQQWQAPEANEFARGGSVEAEARERTDNSYADEMDLRDRYVMPGWDRAAATKIPLGDMAPPRLPKVQKFDLGGLAGPDPDTPSSTFDANQSYADWSADYYGGGLGAALGNTSFGGWDTTSQGWTGGGGYVGNTGGLGLGAYTGNVGSALGNTSGGSFGLGYGEGTVGGSDLGMGSGWGGAGEGNLGQPEPGYSGSAGAIMEGAGLGNVFGGSTEPNYLSQNIGMLGANLLDPTPIAEQSVDRANAIATTADFTPALDPSVALATALPTDMPAPNFGRAAREQEFPAEDPVDFTGPMAGRVPELGVLPDNMPTRADAREQFAREYMRDRLTEQYGRPPSEDFLDAMMGRFKVEAPNLLSGKTPDEVNHIGALGLPQTLGARKEALQEFRAAQDPNVGNLRRDLDYAVQAMSPSTVQIGLDFNNRRDFSRFSDAVVNARNLEEGMRAMNAFERAGGWNGYNTPIGSVDGGKRSMDYAREFQREYNPTAAAGTGRRADAGGILSELFGIGSAQAAERVPGAVAQADIPEIDIWQGEKNILQGIARGLRSITGTTEDDTAPRPAPPSSVGVNDLFSLPVGGSARLASPNLTRSDLNTLEEEAAAMYGSFTGANSLSRRGVDVASLPGLPEPMQVADVPLPPERPTDLPTNIPAPTDDPEQTAPAAPGAPASRPSQVAAAMPDEAMPSTNRFNIDPLTGNLYDPETGNRVIDPRYVSRASDLVIGLTPFGPINSLLALAGGVTGYPLSGGQLMALGRPGAPSGYSVNEGSVYAGRPYEVAAGLPAASGGGGGALSTVAATTQGRVPDYIAREFLGVDESPETYGMRGQRSYYSYG